MKIRAVFFDMGGTIDTHTYDRQIGVAATKRIRQLLSQGGVDFPCNNEQLYDLVNKGQTAYRRWREQTCIELPPERVWREFVFRAFALEPGQLRSVAEELAYTIDTCYYQRCMRPEVPGVLEILEGMGLKLGIISNIQSRGQVPGDLSRYGIKHFFDPVVLSCEFGRRKPDPSIFRHAAGLINVPEHECVHIGDRISRDVIGAKRAGFALSLQIRHEYKESPDPEVPKPDALLDTMSELPDVLNSFFSSGGETPAESPQRR
jgi:putative hydrolase of the HAD superfamily